jgi:hypothetical protein
LLCLRNARAFPLLPAALASVPFGFVLVRVRVIRGFHGFHCEWNISLTNSWTDLAVRTKFDRHYSTVLQYRTAQPLNWFLRYDQSMNLLVKCFVSEISDPWKPLYFRGFHGFHCEWNISLTNSWTDLAVRTKFDRYYSTVLQYRTAQPLNWFLRYDQSMNLLVKCFVSEISDPWKPLYWPSSLHFSQLFFVHLVLV